MLSRESAPILIKDLKAFEYRGYYSAVLATIEHNSIEIVKSVGNIVTDKKTAF